MTLNVCGAVNAGKTTLIQNLQLNTFQRMRRREHLDTSQDMASRTAGIEVGIIDVPGAGEFRKMDMAGHSWAFTSNEYFIGKRTSISLVLFDLSKSDDKVENDLFHHLGMLKARETKHGILRYRPEVVLVATHPDTIEGDPRVRADAYFRMFLESFQAYMNFYPKVMVVNCTDPNNMDFDALRGCLKELRDKIIKVCDKNYTQIKEMLWSPLRFLICTITLPHARKHTHFIDSQQPIKKTLMRQKKYEHENCWSVYDYSSDLRAKLSFFH